MSAVGLVGAGISLAGGLLSFVSQQNTVAKQTAIGKQEENIRMQQVQLDSVQRKRNAVRGALMSRAIATSNSASQGAGTQSSGVLGGQGGAISSGLEEEKVQNSSIILGQRQFKNKLDYFNATQDGSFWSGIGSGLSGVGNTVLGNAGTITSLGMDWFSPKTPGAGVVKSGWGW